jgi:hypothetical protein
VKQLPNHASIFSAAAIAILLALDIINQSTEQDFLILSDSLSCVNAVENPLVVEILERVHQQLCVDRRITFVWVPSHIGIAGNRAVDALAKAGVGLPLSNAEIPHTDFKPLVSSHVKNCWHCVGTGIPTTSSSKYKPQSNQLLSTICHVEMKYSFIVCVSDTHTLPIHTSYAVKLHQSAIFAKFIWPRTPVIML